MKPQDPQPYRCVDEPLVLLSPMQASEYLRELGVIRAPVTLRNLRLKGGGPPFRRFGRGVYYTSKGLDAWVRQKLSKPVFSTSELPTRAA